MHKSLQGSRAVAAALVVLFHLGGTFAQDKYFGFKGLDGPFAWGDAGVDFFFVLSGFLITVMHRKDFGHPRALGNYLSKRTLRIYPTYVLICVAVCLAAVAVPSMRQALPSDFLTLLGALALVPMDPALVGGTGSPILFVAWSLQYEMLFYAIIAVAIVNRVAGVLTALALLLVYLGCQFGTTCGFPQSFLSSNMIFLFAMGVASAYVARSSFRLPFPLFVAIAAAVGFVAFGLFEVSRSHEIASFDRRLLYGALSCFIILGLVQAESDGSLVVKNRWIGLLGDSSYSLYLMHIPVISVLCKLIVLLGISGRPALVVAFVLVFLACVGSALMFHLKIERPMLGWLREKAVKGPKPARDTVERTGISSMAAWQNEHIR